MLQVANGDCMVYFFTPWMLGLEARQQVVITVFKHCSCRCYKNNDNIAGFYTQLSICRSQISCILQFSVISWLNLPETKSTSPEIVFYIIENNLHIFAIKCLWKNELCVIYAVYFIIITKWISFFKASKQAGSFWTAWPLSQHWRCQIFSKCNIQLSHLSMQLPSEVIQPFSYLFVSIWRSSCNFTSNVKSAWLWKRCEKRFFPWPSQTTLALQVTEIQKCFKWRGSSP